MPMQIRQQVSNRGCHYLAELIGVELALLAALEYDACGRRWNIGLIVCCVKMGLIAVVWNCVDNRNQLIPARASSAG